MGGYVRSEIKSGGPGEYHPVPKKNKFSHVHDAFQYAVVPIVYPLINEPRDDIKEDEALVARMRNNLMGVRPEATSYNTFDPRR